jgi:hypothetical protein
MSILLSYLSDNAPYAAPVISVISVILCLISRHIMPFKSLTLDLPFNSFYFRLSLSIDMPVHQAGHYLPE